MGLPRPAGIWDFLRREIHMNFSRTGGKRDMFSCQRKTRKVSWKIWWTPAPWVPVYFPGGRPPYRERKMAGRCALQAIKAENGLPLLFSGWPRWYPGLGKILLFSMVPSARSASVPVSNRKAGLSVPPMIWSRYSLSIRMEPSGWNAITWEIGIWN